MGIVKKLGVVSNLTTDERGPNPRKLIKLKRDCESYILGRSMDVNVGGHVEIESSSVRELGAYRLISLRVLSCEEIEKNAIESYSLK